MIRLAGVDSGKQRDQSCLVSLHVDPEKHEAFVSGCKFWPRKTDYQKIESDIARLQAEHHWDHIIVEVNNVGEHVYESMLKRYGLPVKPVTTVHKLSGDRIKKSATQILKRSMPKNEIVVYFLVCKMRHKIKFPPNPSKDMLQLQHQLTAFSETKTNAGNVSYGAPASSHDDGVMALLMALFYAKPYLEEGKPAHVGGGIPRRASMLITESVMASDFI